MEVIMDEKKETFDVKKAGLIVEELRKSYKSRKTRSYDWRVTQLKSIMQMITDNEKDILHALHLDLSKPHLEAYVAEVVMTKKAAEFALKELKRWMCPEKARPQLTTFPSSAEIVSEPLGVVLVIGTWNFPFLLLLEPLIGAISAGNAVVVKPSEISPATSSLIAKLLPEYMDNTAIRVVEGAVAETSALLEQRWDKIFYTGSSKVGRIVMAAAVKNLTPVILELGGKCPVVVDSNVNLKVAVRRIISGKWGLNNGQTCVAPDYIITTKSFAPKLIDTLKHTLEEFYGKNAMESKDMAGIVNSTHFNRLTHLLDEDKVSDKIVIGGQRDEKQLKIAPTVLLDVPEDSLIMKDEIFGPLLPIVTVENLEESFDLINSKPKPLTAYLFTSNKQLIKDFVNDISAGGMLINDTTLHLTVNTLPFGGVGESGMGSYHGKFSFDAFSHKKAVFYRSQYLDVWARYPPFTLRKRNILTAVVNGSVLAIILAFLGWSNNEK